MIILAIESSCDDTSVALLECNDLGIVVLSQKTASQTEIHKKYGGVIPELAGRKHAETIIPLVEEIIGTHQKPDLIAVTSGPGLITGLLVGTEVAKNLSFLWDLPVIGVNHIEGHIYSNLLVEEIDRKIKKEIEFPAMCLIVSGGHTELILMKDHGKYELVGKTRDDAVGEAFDKVAKLLGMEYPGGPQISACAKNGNPTAINFPRPMLNADNFDFSFAGLKTAVLYYLKDNPTVVCSADGLANVCASFQVAAIDVLVQKTIRAAKKYDVHTIIIGGGVSNNTELRTILSKQAAKHDIKLLKPPTSYTMDNAAMIGVVAYYRFQRANSNLNIKNIEDSWHEIVANPNWHIYD